MENSICNWLFSNAIQLSAGPYAGGIVGWLEASDTALFVYPEITGYYLSFLTFQAENHPEYREQCISRAGKAVEWLHAIISGGSLATRYYLTTKGDDWRNQALFAFDVAMIIKGLHHAGKILPGDEIGAVTRLFMDQFRLFITEDAALAPCIPAHHRSLAEIPSTWSTRSEPFQTKIAASLLMAHAGTASNNLVTVAEEVIASWSRKAPEEVLSGSTHSLLYYLEGLFLYALKGNNRALLEHVSTVYARLMLRQRNDGSLPWNVSDGAGATRSDVQAQALRLGSALVSLEILERDPWLPRLQRLADRLAPMVTGEGAVVFTDDPQHPRHLNVWCSMFSLQAFNFHQKIMRKKKIDAAALALVI